MIAFILWYLIATIIGLLAFPLAYRLFPALADRGYSFSRVLGLLLWGYTFWLLGSLGLVGNDLGGELFALLVLLGFGGWALKHAGWKEIRNWLCAQRRLVLAIEGLFLLSFLFFAFLRSANPEITGTEKPMELAFINALLRSPALPSHDPWLSGYAISYYYFGYVLVAMLARLAGTSGGVAFNLGISLIFSLAALGSYGVLFNLLARRWGGGENRSSRPAKALNLAFLAPFFVLIVSNMGGLLHLLRLGGVFWRQTASGEWVSPFWTWLDIGQYADPPPSQAFPHWWWWQASRIVQDFDFNGLNKGDIIDEFPFFSFLLGDLHPHVLAMPFNFLVIGLSLNLFFGGARGEVRWLGMRFRLRPLYFWISALAVGSLGFFNTWDFPMYVALFAGAYALRGLFDPSDALEEGISWGYPPRILEVLLQIIRLGFALGVSGVVLFLPFYLGFQSQAGGLLPNLIYITRGVYLWIHFVPFLVPIFAFLIYLWASRRKRLKVLNGVRLTAGIILLLFAMTHLLAYFISVLPAFQNLVPEAANAAAAFLGSLGAPGWVEALREGLARRVTVPGTLLTLAALLALGFAWLWPGRGEEVNTDLSRKITPDDLPTAFSLFLILAGALLVLVPEFVYLRDLFGYRINTIFKFYYQVWLMWGVAAAYATIFLWEKLQGGARVVFGVGMALLLVLALTYPLMGVWSRTAGFRPAQGFTLDGTAYLEQSNPDEKAAMDWLLAAPLGVVAEAVGGSYTGFARMSVHSGQPTVLGWEFHEIQWRGGTEEMGSRRADVERLYCTPKWDVAKTIIDQYAIRYVVVGGMERIAYARGSLACPAGMSEAKFTLFLQTVFQQGGVTVYQVP